MASIMWRVGELAEREGWTASRLARVAGLDQKTVRNIMSGRAKRVDLETIARLAETLGVPIGALWRVRHDRTAAWAATAGAAGRGAKRDIDEALSGTWSEFTDPALERAGRS